MPSDRLSIPIPRPMLARADALTGPLMWRENPRFQAVNVIRRVHVLTAALTIGLQVLEAEVKAAAEAEEADLDDGGEE